jgi:Poly(3-hydroxybutyrate) depolymerase
MSPDLRTLLRRGLPACLAFSLAACGQSTVPVANQPLAADPSTTATVAGVPGTLQMATGSESFTRRVTFNGIGYNVLYIRPTAAPSGAVPLLLMLPYSRGTPTKMANLTQVSRLAANQGVWIALPPIPGGNKWNENPANGNVPDDVGYLQAVLSDAAGNLPIDTGRIYGTGYSNSGFMVERLACNASSPLAGIALIAATGRPALDAICAPPRPIRVLFFNGTADHYVPYDGQTAFGKQVLDSVATATNDWTQRSGCAAGGTTTALPTVVQDGTSVSFTIDTQCPANAAVGAYRIDNGGHTWPDNPYAAAQRLYLGRTTGNVDATLALWQFFSGN